MHVDHGYIELLLILENAMLLALVTTVLVMVHRLSTRQAEDRQRVIIDLAVKAEALARVVDELRANKHKTDHDLKKVEMKVEEATQVTKGALPDLQETSDDTNVRVRKIEKEMGDDTEGDG